MTRPDTYIGIDKDVKGGMTNIGKIILDAWVFELLPESETCEGWQLAQIEALHYKVNTQWDKYGCLVSQLPDAIRQRHERIYNQAITKAKEEGWDGDDEIRDDH
jgi:hypothetical protein